MNQAMGDPTDEELMERFQAGDPSAFEALFDRLSGRVQSYLRPMVRDAALAEDLAQATFLSVVRSKDRYERGASVAAWVLAIAANAARDAMRRQRRGIERLAFEGERVPEPESEAPTGDPGLRRELQAALEALPELYREAVLLHHVQGLPFEEVAEILGTTRVTARVRAHRGYEKLRGLLSHLEDGR